MSTGGGDVDKVLGVRTANGRYMFVPVDESYDKTSSPCRNYSPPPPYDQEHHMQLMKEIVERGKRIEFQSQRERNTLV